mgnify:CR=1 FL=1
MVFSKTARITACALFALFAAGAATAQNYRLPGQHQAQTEHLLANQVNVGHTLSVDPTIDYLNYAEEEEPELDIYEEGWDSNRVNCYSGMHVPDRVVITGLDKFCMPHPGYITSPYGYRRRFRRMHKGVDLKLNIGDTIRAAFDGRVRLTKYEARGYGKYVVVRHTNDLETVYGHLSRFLVEPGTYVKAGDPIALGGNTGRSTGPHLHFETRYMGYAINPMAIFDFANQTTHTDSYTFDKRTYTQARNYSPEANAEYARSYNSQTRTNRTATSRTSSSRSKTVTVRKGDSLSRIAARNNTTVKKLLRLNNLKSTSKLQPGQRIRVS